MLCKSWTPEWWLHNISILQECATAPFHLTQGVVHVHAYPYADSHQCSATKMVICNQQSSCPGSIWFAGCEKRCEKTSAVTLNVLNETRCHWTTFSTFPCNICLDNSTFYIGQILMFLSALLGESWWCMSSSYVRFEEILPSYPCHQLITYAKFMTVRSW